MVRSRPFLVALLLFALLPASAAANSTTRIIVKRDAGLSAAERADIRADAGVRLVEALSIPRTEVVAASAGEAAKALRELNADRDVVYAERDRRRAVAAADSHWGFLWGVQKIAADDAWQVENVTGDAQVVAVVDSGVDPTHPDLLTQIHSAKNFVDEDVTDASDGDGHGTHVSGTIAATYDNGEGIAGVAPGARIMALRALDDDGAGYDSDIAEAFEWAGDNGVRVVNASLGGEGASQTLRDAIHGAPNTLFVVAAANDGSNNDATPIYPCNTPEPNVLCVGATAKTDDVASWSNFGARSVDVFAPGVGILSTVPGASYESWGGTSMATPHVSAVGALVLEAKPQLTPEQLKEVLLESARPDARYEAISVSGARIDALQAVRLARAGTALPDVDGDGWSDAADACPTTKVLGSPDGCPRDDDWDGVADPLPPTPTPAPTAPAPPAPMPAPTAPAPPAPMPATPPPAPAPAPAPPADRDGDGIQDGSDACPAAPAPTADGCPLPQVSATPRRHSATVQVVAGRQATVRITVERKRGRRWVRVIRKTRATVGNTARVRVSPLRRGRHRVRITIGRTSVTKGFRVR
jgi:thermitase